MEDFESVLVKIEAASAGVISPCCFFLGFQKSKSITFSKTLEKPLLTHKHTFFYCPLLQASYCTSNHPSRVQVLLNRHWPPSLGHLRMKLFVH